MKVVFVHTDFRIYWPGRLRALHSFFSQKGIELFVIEIAGAGSPYDFAIEGNSYPSYWHCLFPDERMEKISISQANTVLWRKLNELDPDVVFSGAIAYPSGATALRWTLEHRKKCVIFDNARLEDVPRNRLVNHIKRVIYSTADAIFCPSSAWNETYRFFGFIDEQIFHGLNVVDNEFWKCRSELAEESLPQRYFLTIGRQIPKKNFLFLLRSYLEYCKSTSVPVPLVMVGNGPKRKILETFVKENGLTSVFLYSYTSQFELKKFYRNALCFILPSRFGETWGLVVNEAMASSLPVLVSEQVGSASTLVKEGINGYVFSPYDSERLSTLMSLITDMTESERIIMGRKSLEIIADWGYEKFCSGVYDSLSYVLKTDKRSPGLEARILLKLWKGRYRPL